MTPVPRWKWNIRRDEPECFQAVARVSPHFDDGRVSWHEAETGRWLAIEGWGIYESEEACLDAQIKRCQEKTRQLRANLDLETKRLSRLTEMRKRLGAGEGNGQEIFSADRDRRASR